MITKRVEKLLDSMFTYKRGREETEFTITPILKLRLERNAIEQVKFAQWMYGEGLAKCISKVKNLILSNDPNAYFVFDYSKSTFKLQKPQNIKTDEFYYLFDYLKELYTDNGYKVIESIKESTSEDKEYSEIERYVLVNTTSNHLINLQVTNNHKGETYILGLGYPVDDDSQNGKDPLFFRVLKSTF